MHKFSLSEALKNAGRRMAAELASSLVPHSGEQGAAREQIVRTFLRSHLPARFDVSSGFVFDAHGTTSQQLDIIIADAMVTPRFEVAGGVRFYPCESVVAVGQVRTHCDSRRKVWDALSNLRSATGLDRSAGGQALCDRSGAPIDHQGDHLDRVFSFLFVVDKALEADSMREVLLEFVQRTPAHEWPNLVIALDRYLITYACDDGVCPNTIHARGIAVSEAQERSDALLEFYVFLSQAVSSTRVARVSSWHHLRKALAIDADVIYSLTGDPPPYLETLGGLPFEYPYDEGE